MNELNDFYIEEFQKHITDSPMVKFEQGGPLVLQNQPGARIVTSDLSDY